MKLLIDFLPIVIFFLVYKWAPELISAVSPLLSPEMVATLEATKPIVIATGVLIPATIIQVIYLRVTTGKVEKMHLVTLALVVILGGATLISQNAEFLMWKPTIVNWLFAAAFLGTQWFTEKSLIQRMMEQAMTLPDHVWTRLSYAWVAFFVVSGLANLYVAYTFSEELWVDFKLFGLLGLTILFIIGQSLFLYRYMNHEEQ
ncbi:MAG: septation protein A [Oceanospirillaceae bacterium]|uniref:septation protein A n=1 Tax=unclassified Thalassolituus TaxID=2624967 RepID=UPI000C5C9231|nr:MULTISPECIES: septation protein A [unclassified Thalassolituus]MAS23894.1 septation protein A [Oceanospirillaceae bacterium]MAY00797.1 septation protein A [Oceanospirillaceae bacterium]MBL33833.1 septation protein A [Oceanospirillaceae bacterium]MBS51630.1 septation protein A [Oceanospirillaceae bacterium]|tara:strand:- start:1385 stop:1990 length:606 start_codon:yes stop_codon:yes gene_type:complete